MTTLWYRQSNNLIVVMLTQRCIRSGRQQILSYLECLRGHLLSVVKRACVR